MKSTFLTLLKYLIGWPLSVVALFFIGKAIFSQKDALMSFSHLTISFLALSIFLFCCYFLIRSFAWKFLLSTKGFDYPIREAAMSWELSELQRYIPGNFWSFLGKTSRFSKKGESKKSIFSLLFLEIVYVCLGSLVVALFSYNFLFFGLLKLPSHLGFIVWIAMFITILFLSFFTVALPYLYKKYRFIHIFTLEHISQNLTFLFYMSIAFLFFGLGTYFAISAYHVLYFPHIFSFSGFFAFAYLIGFLALIMPMGLGVREAVMTTGLALYTPFGIAAAGTILGRIVLIFAEVLFLALTLLWNYSKKSLIIPIEQKIAHGKYAIGISIASISYALYFSLASILRYNNFFAGRFDLGNMDQTVWNTVHGRIFQLTNPDSTNIVSRLGTHADFMLVLLAPLYYIWQDPRMLLLIQSIALGAGGIFVYLIAQNIIKNKILSFLLGISYLIYPGLNYANLYDFHAVTLAAPLFLVSWYLICKKHYTWSIVFLLLSGTTKEEVWVISGLIGLYIAFFKKQYFLGIFTALVSFGLFVSLFWYFIPQARGAQHFALSYYSDFGASPTSILANIFLSPIKTLHTIFSNGQLKYLLQLFAPVSFLPLIVPFALIFALPDLGISLLSKNAQLHTIYFHYSAILVPFIFISTIYAVSYLLKKLPYPTIFFALLIIVPAIYTAYLYGPLPGAKYMDHDMFTNQLSYASDIDNFLLSIPRRYSVAATNNVGSHLSHRQLIYTIPTGIDSADIIVMLLNDQYAQPSLASQIQMSQDLKHDPRYVTLFEEGDFVVFKKKNIPTRPMGRQHNFLPLFRGN